MVRSRNHAMMGHVKEWLTSYVLGIRAASPGYRKIMIEPTLTHLIQKASGSVSSPYGDICVKYERNGEALCLEVCIPVGAIADIQLPTHTIFNVGSGSYTFT